MTSPATSFECITNVLNSYFPELGFEVHPFLVGWYNEKVNEKFRLNFDNSCLAFVILSTPSMFERSFVPYLKQNLVGDSQRDPLDSCMIRVIGGVRDRLPHDQLEILHDFELHPNRRPKVLVQTAAHVSGCVQFIQSTDVENGQALKNINSPKVYPVCMHPKYGGWFAIRAVIVFPEVKNLKTLPKKRCQLNLSQDDIVRLLKLYNDQWQDWTFRDVINPIERYSNAQMLYFSTAPSERTEVINKLTEGSL